MRLYWQIIFTIFYVPLVYANSNVLNIYTWGGEYLPNSIVLQFTKETGIKVNLTEYDNNETMFAKLKVNNLGYDIVMPSSYYIERMSKQGMLQKINKKKLTNWHNINPLLLNLAFDPHNDYSIPYSWGSTGILINTKYIAKVKSWQDFWDPKYKNQLMLLNDMRDVFSIALLTLGYPINDTNPQHITAAYLKLKKLLPNVKLFNVDTIPNIYVDEDVVIGMAWSGESKLAQKENSALQYIYPQEGFTIWIDSFAIVKDAANTENAYKFINFMLRRQIAKQASLLTGYASANQAAMKLMPLDLLNNPVFNPSKLIMRRSKIPVDLPEKARRLYEKYWEKLQLGG